MKTERKTNHGFWATPTDYRRLADAAQAAEMPIGDYIIRMLDEQTRGEDAK